MRGIDIASYQAGLKPSAVDCDFIIIKATQGTGYVNPDFTRAADETLACGKLLGLYHYAEGRDPVKEADFFLAKIKAYIGKATLWLDWEGEQNGKFGHGDVEWCRKFCARVKCARMKEKPIGRTCGIYMSKSVCRTYDWTPCKDYPLWCAQYASMTSTGWQDEPWTDKYGFGAWGSPAVYQYTSNGRVDGWKGRLDLDQARITREQWTDMAGGKAEPVPFADKSDTDLALEVWAGIHGNDQARKDALGIRYSSVQSAVEQIKTVSDVMRELEQYEKKCGALFKA